MYRAVLFDLDGTLTETRSVWQYIHERVGTWEKGADRNFREYRRGRIGYEEFCERDAGSWGGWRSPDWSGLPVRSGFGKGPRASSGI